MSQSRHNVSKQAEMVSDCASGGSRYDTRKEDQCYSKSGHMLGHSKDNISSSPTDKYSNESGHTDSGFLSGAIASEQSISSSDDLSSSNILSSGSLKGSSNINYTDSGFLEEGSGSMRLDSGVIDCGITLSDKFSVLDIKKGHQNDLNAPRSTTQVSSTKSNITVVTAPNKPSVTPTPAFSQKQELDKYLEFFRPDQDGDTQLHLAVLQGFIEAVYSLIRLAAHPCLLDMPNDLRQTPMHLAVLTAQAPIVRALLVAGASPDVRDRQGNTPLHLSSMYGATECASALLKPILVSEIETAGLRYKPAISPTAASNIINEPNYDGQLCVHLAAAGGHVDVLRHLNWAGADFNGREGKLGRTALHVAAERGRRKVFEFLLCDCGKLDLCIPTFAGHTAYQIAQYVNPDLARELASRGGALRLRLDSSSESDSEDDEMFGHELPCEQQGFFRRAVVA